MGEISIVELQKQIGLPLITRDHPSYDGSRRVWNAMIDRRPLLIAQPRNPTEVAAAIAFARTHDLPLAVKGGGHGVAGRAVCDNGVVIDLSGMGDVSVDPAAKIATVQGGATLRSLDAGSQAHGLATTAGIYCGTGVAGLALGGGVGLLMRRFGLTCDNLLAAEIVTADGSVLETNDVENPDLYWALRGGGGNFGVVTRMEFRLYPLTHVLGGRLSYSFSDLAELGSRYCGLITDAPDDLQLYLNFSTSETEPSASIVFCHCGSPAEGDAALARVRAIQRPVEDSVSRLTYLQMQQHWDDSFPLGRMQFWKSSFLTKISDDMLRVCTDAIKRQPLPNCRIAIEPMGGAISGVAPDATAFADRDTAGTLLVMAEWTDPNETEARIGWVRETWGALQPFANRSTYINYLDQGDEQRTEAAFGANYNRLVEIKRRYDPDNLFQSNANIRP